MKRFLVGLLSVLLLLGMMPLAQVTAEEPETILLAGSDFQVSNHNTRRIEQVLETLEIHGITKADGAFFCGDYTLYSEEDNQGQSSLGLSTLKQLFTPIVGNKMTFVQGNHDPEDTEGLSPAGNNDPSNRKYGVYVIHEDQYLQYNWDYSRGVVEQTAADLKSYLDEKIAAGWNKPIFVLSHVGLHWGNRTILQGSAVHGDLLVDVLNEAGEKGLNIIFLYGHDHSGGYADFIGGGAVYFKKGDQMEVCTGQKKEHETRTLKFTYMNAGYIGYYTTNSNAPSDCDTAVTMSVFRIRGNEVIITRYDGEINLAKDQNGVHNLKSKGVYSDYFYEQHGYHVEVDTREYASSRKVTATGDVPVDPPAPPATTTTTTTTETEPIGVQQVTKPTKGESTTGMVEVTNPNEDIVSTVGTDATVSTNPTDSQATDTGATNGTQADTETTDPTGSVAAPESAPGGLFSLLTGVLSLLVGFAGGGGIVLLLGGIVLIMVILLVVVIVVLLLVKRKKNRQAVPAETAPTIENPEAENPEEGNE